MSTAALIKFRKQIDKIDKQIVKLLSERFEVTRKVGKYKKKNNLNLYDKKREIIMFESRAELAKKLDVNADYIIKLFQLTTAQSKEEYKNK